MRTRKNIKVFFVSFFLFMCVIFSKQLMTHPFFFSSLPPKSFDEFAIFHLFSPHTAQTRIKNLVFNSNVMIIIKFHKNYSLILLLFSFWGITRVANKSVKLNHLKFKLNCFTLILIHSNNFNTLIFAFSKKNCKLQPKKTTPTK